MSEERTHHRESCGRTIARLQSVTHNALSGYIDGSAPAALLDFPNHSNVGDSAIWIGEIAYLRQHHGIRPAFVCTKDQVNWEVMERAVPTGPILIHGGGNFGDIWPEHQLFREAVLKRFPGRLVVQLPQSIHFSSSTELRRAAEVIKAHGNFVLFVRDKQSYQRACDAFSCPIHLCPDMALCLGPLQTPVQPTHELLFLLRTDKERSVAAIGSAAGVPDNAVVADWLEEDARLYQKIRLRTAASSLLALGHRVLDKNRQRERFYRNLAESRLDRGLRLLSSARAVITDRLHAHILCMLLGVPHSALDNSYGKLSGFIEAWTKSCEVVNVAPNLDRAIVSCRASMRAAQAVGTASGFA
jgi:exopolysaccharide biosynthesis predicted pyruvyltransferase EpsI